MNRENVLAILAAHREELQGLGVKSLALFGSMARGEAGRESDVDILVEFDRPTGLFGVLEVQHRLEEILGLRVDLVTGPGVHPALRDRIFAEAVNAF